MSNSFPNAARPAAKMVFRITREADWRIVTEKAGRNRPTVYTQTTDCHYWCPNGEWSLAQVSVLCACVRDWQSSRYGVACSNRVAV